ncbi:TPA: hypothetical protein N0F65_010318 [Lagenidium giganteum]|uniref:C2 domain-containing protein n=1 Tax=Lagenidium giganteum TaxID=4803 RepID=A0AAV2Z7N2_9STRA|nr:TPA: hypothetical protein N0F65_010318 [Lagenidium giganteum]
MMAMNDDTSNQVEQAVEDESHTRARRRSDAEARNQREHVRQETHKSRLQAAMTNNRFFKRSAAADTKPEEGDSDGDDNESIGDDHSKRSNKPNKKKRERSNQKEQEDNNAEDKNNNDNDDDDDDDDVRGRSDRMLSSSVVMRPKRSSAASAGAGEKKTTATTSKIVVQPAVHVLPALTLSRSSWLSEVREDRDAGLYVADERQQLEQIAPSTLLRVEERLRREHPARADAPRRRKCLSTNLFAHFMQWYGHRIVLDDHVAFTLEDRVMGQIKSLYGSYTQLVRLQPWSGPLERVAAFVEEVQANSNINGSEVVHVRWQQQTLRDAHAALDALGRLQQLHHQLVLKWNELQACCRRERNQQPLFIMKLVRRAGRVAIVHLQALLECLPATGRGDSTEGNDNNPAEHVRKRLDDLYANDKCLDFVVQVENSGVSRDDPVVSSATSSGASRLLGLACFSTRPTFVVELHVNNRLVSRTRAMSWAPLTQEQRSGAGAHVRPLVQRGVVHLGEAFRVELTHFPESVTFKVFEQGWLVPRLLSTASIALLVPGDDVSSASETATTPERRVPLAGVSPSDEWYQFTCATPMARERWHPSFHNAATFATLARHTHGRVHARVSWVAKQATDSAAVGIMLPSKQQQRARARHPSEQRRLVGTRLQRQQRAERDHRSKTGFMYERDFLTLMKSLEHVVDPNDPDNAGVQRLHAHLQGMSTALQQRDLFRTTTLSPGNRLVADTQVGVLTKRNQLLRLRDREHVARFGTSVCESIAVRQSVATSSSNTLGTKRWEHAVFDEPVPLHEHDITANAQYLSLLRPEVQLLDRQIRGDAASQGDAFSIERQRKQQLLKLHDFLDRVKQTQLVAGRKVVVKDRTKTLASIIQEQPMPLFPGTMDLSGLGRLFAPRRRLRPQAQKRAAPTVAAEWPAHCVLYVQVQKAVNVPTRLVSAQEQQSKQQTKQKTPEEEADSGTPRPGAALQLSFESQVFVEVCFQGQRRKTSCSLVSSSHARGTLGSNPVWMETLVLPFVPPMGDWSPEALQRVQDDIRLNLFDQVVTPQSDEADGVQLRSFHQENCFLGGLSVPFATLYQNDGLLEASLRCEMPVEHLGYANLKALAAQAGLMERQSSSEAAMDKAPSTRKQLTATDDPDGVIRSSRAATFLSVMLTLDPLLPQPVQAFDDALGGGGGATDESPDLVAYARTWVASVRRSNTATKQRDLSVFVRNVRSGKTFVSRYLCPQQPPAGHRASVAQLVRLVKLVPFLEDWHVFDGEHDVWSTTSELLELNAGDYEEHAVLLCNFFAWFDRDAPAMRSYLVLGTAVPEGRTVYVLRQDTSRVPARGTLWNASTGVGYNVLDDHCPVRDVSLVVSSANVYANVQQVKRLADLTWDMETNAKAWRPFFHTAAGGRAREQFVLPSVQDREPSFSETPREYVQQVETELKEALKLEIRRWRSTRFTTTFNMDVSVKLRTQLESLETAERGDPRDRAQTQAQPGRHLLADIARTREICGMPLNTTFTDMSKVIAMVKNTNIHWNERTNVEFGLAVYVHGYPNCLLSVWVYFVSLVPK